jgi:hypothetical protein
VCGGDVSIDKKLKFFRKHPVMVLSLIYFKIFGYSLNLSLNVA